MRKKYIITIEETVSEDFEVEADSEKEVIETACCLYCNAELVLSPGKPLYCQLTADGEKWVEM